MTHLLRLLKITLVVNLFFNNAFSAENIGGVTGLPVPRYVVLKSKDINVRVGPSITEPLKLNYKCMFNPVQVVAEFDNWRQIKDSDDNDGWVHEAMLDGKKFVKINSSNPAGASIFRLPNNRSKVIAIAEKGFIAKLLECKGDWCKLALSNTHKGWVHKKEIWGV